LSSARSVVDLTTGEADGEAEEIVSSSARSALFTASTFSSALDSESASESELDDDEDEDTALRFTPAFGRTGDDTILAFGGAIFALGLLESESEDDEDESGLAMSNFLAVRTVLVACGAARSEDEEELESDEEDEFEDTTFGVTNFIFVAGRAVVEESDPDEEELFDDPTLWVTTFFVVGRSDSDEDDEDDDDDEEAEVSTSLLAEGTFDCFFDVAEESEEDDEEDDDEDDEDDDEEEDLAVAFAGTVLSLESEEVAEDALVSDATADLE
jgi:hypothetical protein